MIKEQINRLISKGIFPEDSGKRELIETHISWVIVCDQFVYKIKKPLQYSFLDFSTLKMRKHFCNKEIELNKRFTENIYLDVQAVHKWQDTFIVGGNKGHIIDYAVRMNKLDREKQMDHLLIKNKVTESDIKNLAKKIAFFHKYAAIIRKKDFLDIQEKFNDLEAQKEYLAKQLGRKYRSIINHAIEASNLFFQKNSELLASRLNKGFFRDCHGDLHSRNIFLLPAPVPFDCIEFNDDLRQIDVLNEVAFLCMDLDAFGRPDLSYLFTRYYNRFFPTMKSSEDRSLFIYYKAYRANVRAKVNSLRAKSTRDRMEKTKALTESKKYLQLMNSYLKSPEYLQ